MADVKTTGDGAMTKQIDTAAFKAELEALCEKHGVYLTTTLYDFIQVYRRHPSEDGPVNWADDWDQVSDE